MSAISGRQVYTVKLNNAEDCWEADRATGTRLDRQDSFADIMEGLGEVICDDFDCDGFPHGLTLTITATVVEP